MKNLSGHNKNLVIPKIKRYFDVVFSLLLILFLSPLIILIMLAIFIEHIFLGYFSSSLFYIEIRISQGKPFNFIKFNIFNPRVISRMNDGHEFIHTKKLENDPKGLIKAGHLLQKVYLDELPQLFNILTGDLSFVGPRPVNLEIYNKRLDAGITTKTIAKAGLTGNYQSLKGITKRSEVELDQEYIDYCLNNSNWKILLHDIKIMSRTFLVVIRAQGL